MGTSADKDAGRFFDTFEADHAESMKDPEYAAAYRAAEQRQARMIEQQCSEGNCVEFIDPDTGENTGGWGPVGCPCQDEDTRVIPPGVSSATPTPPTVTDSGGHHAV